VERSEAGAGSLGPGGGRPGGLLLTVLLPALLACGDHISPPPEERPPSCRETLLLPERYFNSGPPNTPSILPLDDPELVGPADPDADFVADTNRVVGLYVDGEAIAVPENILWWHEAVNFDFGGTSLSVTRANLTGSSRVYGREDVEPPVRLRRASPVFMANTFLVEHPPSESSTFSLQLTGEPACGPAGAADQPLESYPAVEMSWEGWKAIHPETRVVSRNTGFRRDYTRNPLGPFLGKDDPDVLGYPGPPIDERRPPKELVLGIPAPDSGGVAYPFLELAKEPVRVIGHAGGGRRAVVFWVRDTGPGGASATLYGDAASANAFVPRAGGRELTFRVSEAGEIVDAETGSVWAADGGAVEGPMQGERLPVFTDAVVLFWYAWAWFHPRTRIWEGE